jgi:hypothetical protein
MNEEIPIDEACSFLKCGKPRLFQALETGSIPGIKLGQTWVIPRFAFFQAINELAISEAEARRANVQRTEAKRGAHVDVPGLLASEGRGKPAATGGPETVRLRSVLPADAEPATTESWNHDKMIEEYSHKGMLIQIYQDAPVGSRPPSYFALVFNPNAKNPTSASWGASGSIDETKKVAEARAERKAFLLEKKANTDDY